MLCLNEVWLIKYSIFTCRYVSLTLQIASSQSYNRNAYPTLYKYPRLRGTVWFDSCYWILFINCIFSFHPVTISLKISRLEIVARCSAIKSTREMCLWSDLMLPLHLLPNSSSQTNRLLSIFNSSNSWEWYLFSLQISFNGRFLASYIRLRCSPSRVVAWIEHKCLDRLGQNPDSDKYLSLTISVPSSFLTSLFRSSGFHFSLSFTLLSHLLKLE